MTAMLRARLTPPHFLAPCQPARVNVPPTGPGWLHEIKHDGFRLVVHRDADRVRAFTRKGHDWAVRFPAVAAAATALRAKSFLIDGEVVAADATGFSSFNLLRQRRNGKGAFCWVFDLLELDGQDLRGQPIEQRKSELARLLKGAPFGLAFNEHHEGDGPALFAEACRQGLEGIVSKRAGSRYRSGRSNDWLKAKNPASPAARREAIEDWAKRR